MAKFREGNLVLTSSQQIKQGGVVLVDADGVANFVSLNVSTDFDVVDLSVTGNAVVYQQSFLAGGAIVDEFSTDGTLADDSDTAVPTEKAVKTYVDTQIASSIPTGVDETIVRYNGTEAIQDSLVTIDDLGNMSGINNLTVTGIIDGDTTSTVSVGVIEVISSGGSGTIGVPLGGDDLVIHNDVDSGFIFLSGTDSGSLVNDMLSCDPNGSVDFYHIGTKVGSTNQWGLTAIDPASPSFIFFDGSTTLGYLWQNAVSGSLILHNDVDDALVRIVGTDSGSSDSTIIEGDPNGPVELFYNGIVSMSTSQAGIYVHDTNGNDPRLTFMDDAGSIVGWVEVMNSDMYINVSGENAIACHEDGRVDLYYNNLIAIQTSATGIHVRDTDGSVPVIELRSDANATLAQIYAANNGVVLGCSNGEKGLEVIEDGAVNLYYNGVKVAETNANGIAGATWG